MFRHLALPATLLHELLHVVIGSLWADRVAIEWRPRSGLAKAHIDWRDDPPRYAVIATGLAPFIAGLLTGGLALAQWLGAGTPTPSTPGGWAFWTVIAMWWVVFVAPSSTDLRASADDGARTDAPTE